MLRLGMLPDLKGVYLVRLASICCVAELGVVAL